MNYFFVGKLQKEQTNYVVAISIQKYFIIIFFIINMGITFFSSQDSRSRQQSIIYIDPTIIHSMHSFLCCSYIKKGAL